LILSLEAQHTIGAGAKGQLPAANGAKAHPGARQASQDMTMGKKGYIAIYGESRCDHLGAAAGNRSGIFPFWAAMAPHTPAGH
jgi:hypothetical protein